MTANQTGARKGFTLIELLVVIAIIGIISTFSVTASSRARNKAVDTAIMEDLRNVLARSHLYYVDHGAYNTGSASFCDDVLLQQVAGKYANYQCNDASTTWVAAIELTTGKYRCVDYRNIQTERDTPITPTTATNCD